MDSVRCRYKYHKYSGPRKSLKLVRASLRRMYGSDITSRAAAWRKKEKLTPLFKIGIKKVSSAAQNNGTDLAETDGQSQVEDSSAVSSMQDSQENTQNTKKSKKHSEIVPRQSTRIAIRKAQLEEAKKREIELAEKKKKEMELAAKKKRENAISLQTASSTNTDLPMLTENSNEQINGSCTRTPAVKWITEVKAYPILWSTEVVRYPVPWDYDGQTPVTAGNTRVQSSVTENSEFQTLPNGVFQPSLNGHIRSPLNEDVRSPSNGDSQPPPNAHIQPPLNRNFRPHSNGDFQTPPNGHTQSSLNGEFRSPSNGDFRPPPNGYIRSPLNGSFPFSSVGAQTPFIIGGKDMESLKTLGINNIPSLLVTRDDRAQTPLIIGNTGGHVPSSAANSPLIGSKVLQSLITTGNTNTTIISENGDQSSVVIRYMDADPPLVNETFKIRAPNVTGQIEDKTTTRHKENETPFVIKNKQKQPHLVTNKESQTPVGIETPITGNSQIGSTLVTKNQSNNESQIPVVIELIDAEMPPDTGNSQVGATLVTENLPFLVTNNESQNPVVIEFIDSQTPITGNAQVRAPSVTTNTETQPFTLTDGENQMPIVIEYIDADTLPSTGNAEIGAHSMNGQTNLMTDKENNTPIIFEFIDNQTPCTVNAEIKSMGNMKTQPLVFPDKSNPVPKVKLPKPKVVKNKKHKKKRIYSKFPVPTPITNPKPTFLRVTEAKNLKTYPVRKKVQTIREVQSPMITELSNGTPTRNNITEVQITIDDNKEVQNGSVKVNTPMSNGENYTETCNIEASNNNLSSALQIPESVQDSILQTPVATINKEIPKSNTPELQILIENKIPVIPVNNKNKTHSTLESIELEASKTVHSSVTGNSELQLSNEQEDSGLQILKVVDDLGVGVPNTVINSGLQIFNRVQDPEVQTHNPAEESGLQISNAVEDKGAQTSNLEVNSGIQINKSSANSDNQITRKNKMLKTAVVNKSELKSRNKSNTSNNGSNVRLQTPNKMDESGLQIASRVQNKELQTPNSIDIHKCCVNSHHQIPRKNNIPKTTALIKNRAHDAEDESGLQIPNTVNGSGLQTPNKVDESGLQTHVSCVNSDHQIPRTNERSKTTEVIGKPELGKTILDRKSGLQTNKAMDRQSGLHEPNAVEESRIQIHKHSINSDYKIPRKSKKSKTTEVIEKPELRRPILDRKSGLYIPNTVEESGLQIHKPSLNSDYKIPRKSKKMKMTEVIEKLEIRRPTLDKKSGLHIPNAVEKSGLQTHKASINSDCRIPRKSKKSKTTEVIKKSELGNPILDRISGLQIHKSYVNSDYQISRQNEKPKTTPVIINYTMNTSELQMPNEVEESGLVTPNTMNKSGLEISNEVEESGLQTHLSCVNKSTQNKNTKATEVIEKLEIRRPILDKKSGLHIHNPVEESGLQIHKPSLNSDYKIPRKSKKLKTTEVLEKPELRRPIFDKKSGLHKPNVVEESGIQIHKPSLNSDYKTPRKSKKSKTTEVIKKTELRRPILDRKSGLHTRNAVEESGLQIHKSYVNSDYRISRENKKTNTTPVILNYTMSTSELQIPDQVEEPRLQTHHAVDETGLKILDAVEDTGLQTATLLEDSGLQTGNTEDISRPQISNGLDERGNRKLDVVEDRDLQTPTLQEDSGLLTGNTEDVSRLQIYNGQDERGHQKRDVVEDTGLQTQNLLEDSGPQIPQENKKPKAMIVIKKSQLRRSIVVKKSDLRTHKLLRKTEHEPHIVINSNPKVIRNSDIQSPSMTGISDHETPKAQKSTNENIDNTVNTDGIKRKVKSKKLAQRVRRPYRKKQGPTAANTILEARVQSIIAKTYLYLSQEYKDLKKTFGGQLDLTSLAKFRRQMAKATGLSQQAINQILKEDEGQSTSTDITPPKEQTSEQIDKIDVRDEKEDVNKLDIKDEIDTKSEVNESEIPKSCDDETLVKLEKIHAEDDCSYFVVL